MGDTQRITGADTPAWPDDRVPSKPTNALDPITHPPAFRRWGSALVVTVVVAVSVMWWMGGVVGSSTVLTIRSRESDPSIYRAGTASFVSMCTDRPNGVFLDEGGKVRLLVPAGEMYAGTLLPAGNRLELVRRWFHAPSYRLLTQTHGVLAMHEIADVAYSCH